MRGYKGDVELELGAETWRLECKSRKSGFSIEYKAIEEGNQACIIKTDRQDPLIVMPLRAFGRLLGRLGEVKLPPAHPLPDKHAHEESLCLRDRLIDRYETSMREFLDKVNQEGNESDSGGALDASSLDVSRETIDPDKPF